MVLAAREAAELAPPIEREPPLNFLNRILLLESFSRNTFEQAVNLHSLLDTRGIERFALVTSPTHMRRAMATFIGQGLNPIPSSSSQHSDGFLADRWVFLPDKNALEASRLAMREGMALVYYALRGWFSPP